MEEEGADERRGGERGERGGERREEREEIGERMYVRVPCTANGRRGGKLKASKGCRDSPSRHRHRHRHRHTTLDTPPTVPAQCVCQPTRKSQMTSSTERVESRSRRQNEGAEGGIKEEEGNTLPRSAKRCDQGR